jgi:hypothetical protein
VEEVAAQLSVGGTSRWSPSQAARWTWMASCVRSRRSRRRGATVMWPFTVAPADLQAGGDLRVGQPLGDELGHGPLPAGRAGAGAHRDAGVEDRLPTRHRADPLEQALRARGRVHAAAPPPGGPRRGRCRHRPRPAGRPGSSSRSSPARGPGRPAPARRDPPGRRPAGPCRPATAPRRRPRPRPRRRGRGPGRGRCAGRVAGPRGRRSPAPGPACRHRIPRDRGGRGPVRSPSASAQLRSDARRAMRFRYASGS